METPKYIRWSGRTFDYDAPNVFGFDTPEKLSCSINAYDAERNRLSVSVKGRDGCVLVFNGMLYFEGPMHWKGANFCTGSAEETTHLIVKLKSPKRLDEDALSTIRPFSSTISAKLFIVDTVNFSVKILASAVSQYYKSGFIWGIQG